MEVSEQSREEAQDEHTMDAAVGWQIQSDVASKQTQFSKERHDFVCILVIGVPS